MIGIIEDKLTAFSIADKIHNKYSQVDIYLFDGDINKGIEILKNKGCIIIITNSNINCTIPVISLNNNNPNNTYNLNDKELIDYIEQGNIKLVKKFLNNLNIKEDTIILNNPKLLYIESIIKEYFPNKKIINNIDYLLDELDKYKSKFIGEGNLFYIN